MTAHNHLSGKNDDQANSARSGPDRSPLGLPTDADGAISTQLKPAGNGAAEMIAAMKVRAPELFRLVAIVVAVVIAASGGYLLGRQPDRAGGQASNLVHADLTYLTALTRSMQSTPGDPIYMHFGSIQGSGTGRFAGWIRLEGWQWGMRTDATSAGDPLFTPVTVSFPADQATPPILGLGAENKPVPGPVQVVFVMGTSQSVTYLQVTLQNTTIGSFSETSSGGKPNDTLSLTVGQFEYQANPPKSAPVKFCWNLIKSHPCTF